jgi:hypothetical protein
VVEVQAQVPNTVTNVEIYDGTSWTETTDIPTATKKWEVLVLEQLG